MRNFFLIQYFPATLMISNRVNLPSTGTDVSADGGSGMSGSDGAVPSVPAPSSGVSVGASLLVTGGTWESAVVTSPSAGGWSPLLAPSTGACDSPSANGCDSPSPVAWASPSWTAPSSAWAMWSSVSRI